MTYTVFVMSSGHTVIIQYIFISRPHGEFYHQSIPDHLRLSISLCFYNIFSRLVKANVSWQLNQKQTTKTYVTNAVFVYIVAVKNYYKEMFYGWHLRCHEKKIAEIKKIIWWLHWVLLGAVQKFVDTNAEVELGLNSGS